MKHPFLSMPFLSMGFRPFYLGAAGFAVLSIPLWIASYDLNGAPLPTVPALLWHSHEITAISRVLGPLLAPAGYVTWLWLSVAFWTLAFAVFFFSYWPILTQPRADAQTSR